MIYYRVTDNGDQYPIHRRNLRSGKVTYFWTVLISGELYTPRELDNLQRHSAFIIPSRIFERINIPSQWTYFCFGGRYVMRDKRDRVLVMYD